MIHSESKQGGIDLFAKTLQIDDIKKSYSWRGWLIGKEKANISWKLTLCQVMLDT